MRKIITAAIAVATLAVPTAAMANAGHPSSPNASGTYAGVPEQGWVGDNPGNSAQYSSTYTDPVFNGPLTCAGVHLKKQNTDNFTCSVGQGASWNGAIPYVGEQVNWNSDYWGIVAPGKTANAMMTITAVGYDAAGNVISYTGTATYPNS